MFVRGSPRTVRERILVRLVASGRFCLFVTLSLREFLVSEGS